MDKWDYLRYPIIEKKSFLVLTSGKFLEALGSGIGTGLVFCHLFSFLNNERVQGREKLCKSIKGGKNNIPENVKT